MADISGKVAQIRQATYGKDVRESLASGIEDIANDVNKFENDTEDKQDDFEQNITKKQNDYENDMNQKQNDYEKKINAEWNVYKEDMDASESIRQSNEQSRENSEHSRKENETVRQENEITRQENETVRQENEQARQNNEQTRETAFAGMEHVDANLELSTARGTYGTLGERLDARLGQIGTKSVDESSIQDNFLLRYDAAKDKVVYVKDEIDRIPPGTISNFTAMPGDAKITLSWVNPTDEDFAGVKILRKEGSYPTSVTDGIVIYVGANQTYDDTNVENDVTYYYRAFPYDLQGNYNTTEEQQQISTTPHFYNVYGVKIDTTNSNPETAVTYTDNAANMEGGSSDWDNKFPFNVIKPCMLKNGIVQYYLNPNDFTKKEDGTDSDITSGADGDVMIEIPKTAYTIYYEGTDLYVKITDAGNAKEVDSRFCYYAHTRDSEGDRDKLYISAFKCCQLPNSMIGSLRTSDILFNHSQNYYCIQANNKGNGYDILGFYPLTLLQVLFIIRYKNLNSRQALGTGQYAATFTNPGTTVQKGMNYGGGINRIKFLGIEDLWGNKTDFIGGICSKRGSGGTAEIFTAFKNFTANYNDINAFTDTGILGRGYGYMNKATGTVSTGFVAADTNGSASTYFADDVCVYGDSSNYDYAVFGSYGIFSLHISKSYDYMDKFNTAHLMYL
ncbi:hypothetical protein KM792_10955 [Clostridium tyrobutyricum]|uniref:hypothetical protein n=1 Tax=Clostridium tyrobutyricum TaxID=1519 RepID=UPI001C38C7B8|nr:hypothetical protein [Clostridium tyrobutyricum]MBV4450171.1 hypothetical protein [Clostridium tyrobutyricum]